MRRALLVVLASCALVGCATTRTVTITTRPPDALIKIDGIDRGRGPITEVFSFASATDVHRVQVSRLGFKDQTVNLTRDYDRDTLLVELKPQSKRVTLNVVPAPANLIVGGRAITSEPVSSMSVELEFTVDARNNWNTHTVLAERAGFVPAQAVVGWNDRETVYTLRLEPMRKTFTINTTPAGAQVLIDGQNVGKSPCTLSDRPFPFDVEANEFVRQRVKVVKAGFDPVETDISWDDGQSQYTIDLQPKSKVVRIRTDPPGGVVTIDGKPLPRDADGVTSVKLAFPPINEQGQLRTYLATVSKKTESSEWYPADLTIGWDDGKQDYDVPLKEILTVPVTLLRPALQRSDEGWFPRPERVSTIAAKDVTEGATREPPVQITRFPRGTQIDTLAIAPDGQRLLFTILLAGRDPSEFRSQLATIRTDGSGGMEFLTDGKSLDLMPSFAPSGDTFVFSSNRAGRRLGIWTMSAIGQPGVTNLTSGESNDLWPCLDSDPKPRLFYQSLIDTRPDPRIFSTQLGTVSRTDLTPLGGMQPRINPKNDTLLFCAVNEKTGKRDIYRMSDRGGPAQNLTNSPDIDEFDAVWNKDGSRVAFVSDRAVDADGRHHYDIWVMDLAQPDQPTQITTNPSHDDCPAWDPSGRAIYFRSNRGGEWGIWKVAW